MNWDLIEQASNNGGFSKLYSHKKYKTPEGDGIELVYNNHTTFSTMEIYLFSGIFSSHLFFDSIDLKFWCDKFNIKLNKENIEETMLNLGDKFVELFYEQDNKIKTYI